MVCITRQVTTHNHDVAKEIFYQYHEQRRVEDPSVLRTVNVLRSAGTKRKKILQYIVENTAVSPTMVDIHNMMAKMKKDQYVGEGAGQRLKTLLEDFAEVQGNSVLVYADDDAEVHQSVKSTYPW